MSDELELLRGSDNPFEDVGLPEADTKRIKADLAAEIIAILRERRLTGAAEAKHAGVQTADISRIAMPICPGLPLTGWSRSSTALSGMLRCVSRSEPLLQRIPRPSFPETLSA
jgi:hypothetical protein